MRYAVALRADLLDRQLDIFGRNGASRAAGTGHGAYP
jgi:hypothetical protein